MRSWILLVAACGGLGLGRTFGVAYVRCVRIRV
ncbi:hypothetical protein COLO4_09108 [Corchorus olitorius]|uniref:Uncharacterized protein n=1 Tax=Corchorus olitorius TaxID=93759 RepID=A0A1R3KD64_9ROSI|nr:hypothetical protein COLO4_09108 [Corchorus olitorius]